MPAMDDIFDIEARVEGPDGAHADGVLAPESVQGTQQPTTKSFSPNDLSDLLQEAIEERKNAESERHSN